MAVIQHRDTSHYSFDDYAKCSCGWESKRVSYNTHKAWRQHVTRGTR